MDNEDKTTLQNMSKSERGRASVSKDERDEHGFTPEMHAIAKALTNPEGDPYENARRMGFYCEQCG